MPGFNAETDMDVHRGVTGFRAPLLVFEDINACKWFGIHICYRTAGGECRLAGNEHSEA